MFETLVTLYENKTLQEMAKRGLVASNVLDYIEIVIWIDAQMIAEKAAGKKPSITKVVTTASAVFSRPIVYVWRAVAAVADNRYKKLPTIK